MFYTHNTHNTQHLSQKKSTSSGQTSWPQIEDDASLDNFEDDKASGDTIVVPDFMPDVRQIMRRFPSSSDVDAAPTEVHAFRETFGTSLLVMQKVWCLLVQEGILPHKDLPKHLLWALHFLKVYRTHFRARAMWRKANREGRSIRRPTKSGYGTSSRPLLRSSMRW